MPEPVVDLLRQFEILKSVSADCLKKPKPKAVHLLRSTMRRIEAILELLTRSTDLPGLQGEAKAFRRSLRKVRRAAGEVRDLDVHRAIMDTFKTDRDAERLEKGLGDARKKAARRLQKRLSKDRRRLARAVGKLETAIAPGVDFHWSGSGLGSAAREWLAEAIRSLDPADDEDLHAIRKYCKTARYIAETGSEDSKTAAGIAKRFDTVQDATGAWHDWLLLVDEAQEALPEGSPLLVDIQRKAGRLRVRAESMARGVATGSRRGAESLAARESGRDANLSIEI